jgi:hypothetical protein
MKKMLGFFLVVSALVALPGAAMAQNDECEQAGEFWICPKPKPAPLCYEFGGDKMICNAPVRDKPPKNCRFNNKNKFVCRDP